MNIKIMLSVLVIGGFIVLVGPPQGIEARSLLNSNATAAEQTTTEVKRANRHHRRRRHSQHRGWSHHLHPGW
ncbi:hypothetical protein [Afipia sp. GAS231]|uniref:hypothetical protein n=1 Tax=Afipia sp. GAS231 TaxID=1882747 RepID=UPI0012FA5047|nr:hypothetical protein [Afipia sp. GAS231]